MGLWLVLVCGSFAVVLTLCVWARVNDPSNWKIKHLFTFPLCTALIFAFFGGLCIGIATSEVEKSVPIIVDKEIPLNLPASYKIEATAGGGIIRIITDQDQKIGPNFPRIFGDYIYAFDYQIDSVVVSAFDKTYIHQVIREKPRSFFSFRQRFVNNTLYLARSSK